MMRTYTIELLKKVPIAETDEAKWLVDTGCPFSYPSPSVAIGEAMASFLGATGLRMLGLDKLGSYILVDYPKGTIVCSDEPIPFEGTSVPLMNGTYNRRMLECLWQGKRWKPILILARRFLISKDWI